MFSLPPPPFKNPGYACQYMYEFIFLYYSIKYLFFSNDVLIKIKVTNQTFSIVILVMICSFDSS